MIIEQSCEKAAPQGHQASADGEQRSSDALRAELRAIQSSYANLPVLDGRHADEILGYDEHGLPA
jgi:hypothetical protein